MMPEQEPRPRIPKWAERERLSDMAWLAENLPRLWPAAQTAFVALGRGAITVDTTSTPTNAGHPFYYLTQAQVNELGDLDALRMVATYDPTWELIAMLLKREERVSTYRIGVPGAQRTPGAADP
jgi:hypothetical protein